MNTYLKWGLIIGLPILAGGIAVAVYSGSRNAAIARRCSGFSEEKTIECKELFKGLSLRDIKTKPIVGTKKPGAA